MDDHYFAEGSHARLFDKMGAHIITHEGVAGTHFAVWAPNATRVSVVGDFNRWDGRRAPLRRRQDAGLWELSLPDLEVGSAYNSQIVGPAGKVLPPRADPVASRFALRPAAAALPPPRPAHH